MKTWKHFTTMAIILIIAITFITCDNDNKETHTHDWQWVPTIPATTEADGVETQTCSTCGATNGTRPIAKLAPIAKTYEINLKEGQLKFVVAYNALPSEEPTYLTYIETQLNTMINSTAQPNIDAMTQLTNRGNHFNITIEYAGTSYTGMNWNTASQSFVIHNDWISTASGTDLSNTVFRNAFLSVEIAMLRPNDNTIRMAGVPARCQAPFLSPPGA